MPVFSMYSLNLVFNQCGTALEQTGVYFMRKHIAESSRGLSYADQEALVRAQGFDVTPLRERAIFNAVSILTSGTCADDRHPWTYARTPDLVIPPTTGNHYHTVIGGFAPGAGVVVGRYYFGNDDVGVVPGGPAEVRGH